MLLNNSPQPGDGVTIHRDIVYFEDDPGASDLVKSKHKLDLYLPAGKVDFPVVFLVHGGPGFSGTAHGQGYLARTFARDGIGVVAINYRLTSGETVLADQLGDIARAFAWTHENIADYGGDTDNLFVMGHWTGARLMAMLATDAKWLNAQRLDLSAIRGAIGVSGNYLAVDSIPDHYPPLHASAGDPPFLLLHGTNGDTEQTLVGQSLAFYAALVAARGQPGLDPTASRDELVPIPNRDVFEMIGRPAQPGDPARKAIFDFIAKHQVLSDLQVTNIVANRAQGNTITLTATIANPSANNAPASQTEFRLRDGTVLGLVATPAIAAGGSATVTLDWKTAGVKGQHVITVTADRNDAVRESDETNNAATLTVTIKGNKATNGSFEQANAAGTAPEGWSSTSTAAGTASWNAAAGSVSFTGTGGSALLSGSPTWTSEPIAVTAGEQLLLMASVSVVGASSGATVSLAYFDATGQLLSTVPVLSVPSTTSGVVTLQQQVTAPLGAASVRIVLTGFAASDPATAGQVTFDGVGLYDLDLLSASLYLFLDDDLLFIGSR
jgi:acetyl esterase/lipase